MRISLQPAFILHHRAYRETSVIIDLLTQDYGRISLIARGVRVVGSRTRSLLQLFIPLLISWQGKGELPTLSSIEPQQLPIRLEGECLLSAFYLNELLVRILHKNDPHSRLYTLYYQTLLDLQQKNLPQKILRLFEKNLLEELGYGLQLQYDIPNNQSLCAESYYRFYPERGFKKTFTKEGVGVFWGKSLLALAAEELNDPQSLQDAKRLMRLAFAPLLGYKPLQSRQLFVGIEPDICN